MTEHDERRAGWNECDAYARSYNENTGRERELTCNLGRHASPGDATADHYDEELDVFWTFADEAI